LLVLLQLRNLATLALDCCRGLSSHSNEQVDDTHQTTFCCCCVQVFVEDMDIDGADVEHAVRRLACGGCHNAAAGIAGVDCAALWQRSCVKQQR
jgi:hypothetical protein